MKSPHGATQGANLKGELGSASVEDGVPLFGCVGELPRGEIAGFGSN